MVKIIRILSALCLLMISTAAYSRGDEMVSPNGKLVLSQMEQADSLAAFTVSYDNGTERTEVMTLPVVGIITQGRRGVDMRLVGIDAPTHIVDKYTMLTGKRLECSNEAKEYLVHFADSLGKEVLMRVRLYDDGVAFRYELPDLTQDCVVDELTTYRIAEGTRRWMQPYVVGYEDFYQMYEKGHAIDNRQWSYPALVQAGDNVWALISESDVNRLQSGSFMANMAAPTDYKVQMMQNQQIINGDWHTPWRVLIVGTLKDVVESTLITDTSTPTAMADLDWIKPGGVSWIYWANNHGSKDYELIKRYVDMAVVLKLPYVLIDWEWDVMGNGGTIEDAVRYANDNNVRPLMWYNSSTSWVDKTAGPLFRLNKPEDREREFAWLKSIGVAGVKIDFFPDDSETTMAYYQDLLETAAKYGLMVNFHGAAIPRGWQRTYPNLMSVEAVYGAEWYNNQPVLTDRAAAHNATLPFTRNVIGSMDYTPCTFSDSQHPHITTHAHELALPVVFESALQHWADSPESYLAQPEEVKNFIGSLPTVWDETRLVGGYPANYVVMARRRGDAWYVGALNGTDEARTLPMDWGFLSPDSTYSIILFEDSGIEITPWKITTTQSTAANLPSGFACEPRGGFVAVVLPQSKANTETNTDMSDKNEVIGNFVTSVLLSEPKWDMRKFIKDLKKKWGIDLSSAEIKDETLVQKCGDGYIVVSLIPDPVPNNEAEECAKANYSWPEAESVAKSHKAQILVAMPGNDNNIMEKATITTKIVDACLKQKYAVAVYTDGIVYQPKFYNVVAKCLRKDILPILDWVWLNVYRDDNLSGVYTCGLRKFGKNEIEVYADAPLNNIRDFVLDIVYYVLENNATLKDGDTLGFAIGQVLPITLSKGIALDGEETLKIAFPM